MQRLRIHSRKLNQAFEFRGEPGEYIRVWVQGSGQWRQICDGGGFYGSTVKANSEGLEKQCRRWYRAYMRGVNE